MSKRNGYYYVTGGMYDGPFPTIKEAKSNALNVTGEVTIRTLVVLEKRDEQGNWQTVH